MTLGHGNLDSFGQPNKRDGSAIPRSTEATARLTNGTTRQVQKKDVSGDFPSAYDPSEVEAGHFGWWNSQGFFRPRLETNGEPTSKGIFIIPAPPPNVTGALHMGHALTIAVQDSLIRWKRMQGFTVLFVPGFDHAGIATQAVVEARLLRTEGRGRHYYGREKFVEKVWAWKEEYQSKISAQMCRMGASYDWERAAFTMSDSFSLSVREAFCSLHEKGLLYRANRLVNWCVHLNTTLSNLEVDQKELTGRTLLHVMGYNPTERFEFGVLTSFAYPIENTDETIVVATTRPETMLGDTAIAVHPDDVRYVHLHGKYVVHPFSGRRIPIITDSITVDMSFGTGAVKITPAHDFNDFECARRNNLEMINLLNDDGTYNENAGEFKGMKRYHVREVLIKHLREKGLFIGKADHPMQIPICSRSGDVVEAIMKPQWWISCKPMADEALKRTKAGELSIRPQTSANNWVRWMENIQDWCVSRQLWWGHRCPAYLLSIDGEMTDSANDRNWIIARTAEEAEVKAKERANGRAYTLEQDEDVLDTWFSAGLWPFSIMGWPEKTRDMELFYPVSVLETGWDILPFWVARMVMLGVNLTGKMPFKEVYCHPIVRDAQGRKMSKSLGNGIDPLDIVSGKALDSMKESLRSSHLPEDQIKQIERGISKTFPKGIPECGADAIRMALVNYCTGGQNVNLEIQKIEQYRKFCNKMWNATKFSLFRFGLVDLDGTRHESDFLPNTSATPTGHEGLSEKWLLHKYNLALTAVSTAMEARDFGEATNVAHHFFLHDLCDVFIEATKPLFEANSDNTLKISAQNTLYTCLEGGLKLLHPFMPYVTEDLWQRLPRRPEDACQSIMISAFPEPCAKQNFPDAEASFDLVMECVTAARSISGAYNLFTNGKVAADKITIIIQAKNAALRSMLESQVAIIIALTKGCGTAHFVSEDSEIPIGCGSEIVSTDINVHVQVKGKIDTAVEIAKLEKKQIAVKAGKERLERIIQQPNYEKSVREEIRASNVEKLEKIESEMETLSLAMDRFRMLA